MKPFSQQLTAFLSLWVKSALAPANLAGVAVLSPAPFSDDAQERVLLGAYPEVLKDPVSLFTRVGEDDTKLVRSIRPEVVKYGFYVPRDSSHYVGETMPWPEFLSYARSIRERNRPAPASAPKQVEIFDVQDQTASAKLTAWWGTDYLLLAKYDGKWMISHVLWQSPPPASR